jgi:hypothetical protein
VVFATRCSAAFLAKYACIKRTLNAIYCFPYTHGQQVEERRKKKENKKEKRRRRIRRKIKLLGSGGVISRASSIFAF